MGAFRTRMCLCGRSLLGRRPLCEFVSASKISVPRSSGDRFDDWVMGLQFEPSYLHHPVLGLRPSSAFERLSRQNGGFSHPHASLGAVSAWRKGPVCGFVSASKISVPRSSAERFDNWVTAKQSAVYLSVSRATPSAKLTPSWPSTDSGCREIVRSDPPTSALAPKPRPNDISPLAPT